MWLKSLMVLEGWIIDGQRPTTTGTALLRRHAFGIALVLEFSKECFLFEGAAAAQEFKQWIFQIVRGLGLLFGRFELSEIGNQRARRNAQLRHGVRAVA
jgi:hypothetical protein